MGLGLWKGRDGLSRTEERSGAVVQSQLKALTYPTGRSDAEIAEVGKRTWSVNQTTGTMRVDGLVVFMPS